MGDASARSAAGPDAALIGNLRPAAGCRAPAPDAAGQRDRFAAIRRRTETLAAPLSAEDQQIQSMPDASPTKWHLAHTSWFFETFVLARVPGYRPVDAAYGYLFNSYYDAIGERHPRARRGLLSRPGLGEVMAYRAEITRRLYEALSGPMDAAARALVELGLHHEQQHQELIVTDTKHALGTQPSRPAYAAVGAAVRDPAPGAPRWIDFEGGLREIGHGGDGFAFDNEGPRHLVWLRPFALASRLATCGEFQAFIDDGGYARPEFWLSEGWAAAQRDGWRAPLYWFAREGAWWLYALSGARPVRAEEPVCHVSFHEAYAFARWSGHRLPTEAEWETAAATVDTAAEAGGGDDVFHPAAARGLGGLEQMRGAVWQWTASPYVAYPGFAAVDGAVGEYNGKFMSGQMVLRGGSVATPDGHLRDSYRNFFPPDARWQFSGVRLARDIP